MAYALWWPALVLAVLLLPWPAFAAVQVTVVPAQATDPALDRSWGPHRTYLDPDAVPRGQLLLFLPGTGGRNVGPPRPFSLTAAELGYHVIELAYPNNLSATVCWRQTDPNCFEKFRREVIKGNDFSPLIAVGRADSIEYRMERLLTVLSARQPARGWGQFLGPRGEAAWEKIAVAGQSQGGGHAALIARDRKVARVLLFGAPKDYDPKGRKPAPWYGPSRTPAKRFFALVHTRDRQGCTFPQQIEIYRAMGMADKPVSVDGAMPPYGNSRILITSYPGRQISSKAAHVVGLSDPAFKPAWIYMLMAGVDR